MVKIISIVFASLLLCGCGSILPGMQNLNTSNMCAQATPEINVTPILIPITPCLIQDEHICKYYYHVAPADVLNISVWQHPEFEIAQTHGGIAASAASTQGAAGQFGYLVNPNGEIYFPLVGNVYVGGKSVDEIRIDITSRLRRYVRNPQVNVRVVDFRGQKVYVFGEVLKPSFLPLNDQPLTIVDALSLAGGIDPNAADTSHIYVIRGDFTHPTIYWLNAKTADRLLLAEHFNLQPGDILYVSSAAATRWNRIINQLLPTIQTIWYTKATVNAS